MNYINVSTGWRNSKNQKNMTVSQLVQKTNLKRKKGKLYYIDLDGDICESGMCGITQHNPTKYEGGKKILKLGIKRESGYLYFIGKEGDVYRNLINNK